MTESILTPEERTVAALGLIDHLRLFTVLGDPEIYLGYLNLLELLISDQQKGPTTMPTAIRRSLELTQAQWDHLETLAIEFETTAKRGPNAHMPSWRSLIEAIASGALSISLPAE